MASPRRKKSAKASAKAPPAAAPAKPAAAAAPAKPRRRGGKPKAKRGAKTGLLSSLAQFVAKKASGLVRRTKKRAKRAPAKSKSKS